MATREELDAAYRRTTYQCGKLQLRIGEPAPLLDRLLEGRGLREWAYLTAWNPRSTPLPLDENRRRDRALAAELVEAGIAHLRGRAIPDDPGWEPEESYLLLGIGRDEAAAIARRWSQNALVIGRLGGAAELIFVD